MSADAPDSTPEQIQASARRGLRSDVRRAQISIAHALTSVEQHRWRDAELRTCAAALSAALAAIDAGDVTR